jgi:16S rRNA G527 N7-methylase RsmG
LVIALAHPGIQAVLLEPSGKKAAFLAEVARKLALTDRVLISRSRLEDYRAVAAGCDFITSRAVRIEEAFLEICRKLLTPKGRLVLWQSEEDFAELRGFGGWNWAEPIRIPGTERRLVAWGRPKQGADVSRET